MSKKPLLLALVILGLVGVLILACGILAYVGYRVLSPAEVESQATTAAPDSTWAPLDTTVGEGTLRLAGSLPPTLDPAMAQDSTSAEYIVHLFSGLVSLNADLEIVPDLATRWEISSDGRSYTFDLNPAATFQDGKAITAEDVIYSIERACSPATQSPVALAYLSDIVGAEEFAAGQADHISGLQALAEHTLQITIDAPKAYFLAKLTCPCAFVVDREQIESEGSSWIRQPNGSGPFVLESIDQESIVLVRNENYYGSKARLARVEFVLSSGLPMTMYENDELDIVGVYPSEIERVLDPENPLYPELHVETELSVDYIGFNVQMPPFDDPAVRQAFARSIDKEKLADLVLKGTGAPAAGILPLALPDFDPTFEGLTYDPEKARQLLASSSYGSAEALPEIVLTISGISGEMDSMTRAVVAMLEENLGIQILVEQVEWSDFLDDLNNHRYQMFSSGWIADYPDSQNFVDLLFHSASSQNNMGYSNPEVDQLLEQARTESDPQSRTLLYRQAERMIVEDAPWIPLIHGTSYMLVKPYVQGFRSGGAMYPWLRDVYIQY